MNLVNGQVNLVNGRESRLGSLRKSKSASDVLIDVDTDSESESLDPTSSCCGNENNMTPVVLPDISKHKAKKSKKSSSSSSRKEGSSKEGSSSPSLSSSSRRLSSSSSKDDSAVPSSSSRRLSSSSKGDKASSSRRLSSSSKGDKASSSSRRVSSSSKGDDVCPSSPRRSSGCPSSPRHSSGCKDGDVSSSSHSSRHSLLSTGTEVSQSSRSEVSRSSRVSSNSKSSKAKGSSSRQSSGRSSKANGDEAEKKSRRTSRRPSSSSENKKDGEERSRRSKSRNPDEEGEDDLVYVQVELPLSQRVALTDIVIREERKRLTWASDPDDTNDRVCQVVYNWENENHPELWWNQKELEMNLRDCMRVVGGMRTSKPGKKYVKSVTRLYYSYKNSSSDTKSSDALQVVAAQPEARGLELHIAFLLRKLKQVHTKKVVEAQKLIKAAAEAEKGKKSTSIEYQIRKKSMKYSRPCRQFAFMVAQYDAHAALKASLGSWSYDEDNE